MSFVPLRILSAYTMLEGAIDPKDIAKTAARLNFPAAALTDRNGLYGAMPFSDACVSAGVQPIIGAMLAVARPGTPEGKPAMIDWLALYAQDEAGYANLCTLVSEAHIARPADQDPHVELAALQGRTDGLIALTAGGEGALARLLAAGQDAAPYALALEALFPGRLYIELSRRGNDTEDAAEPALIDLAFARDLPLVATNPACYPEPGFHAAHDVMLCIAASAYVDTEDRNRSSAAAWIKPGADMEALFDDLPEAIANTAVIARRCAVSAPKRKPILPTLTTDEAEQLRRDSRAGLEVRLAKLAPEINRQPYRDRLEFEVDVIAGMGFPGYFLIVADFIVWAKGQGIPVGPGRGSGAGSVVAWALTITDLDPMRLGLLFERFLNPERVSMPDFDIDFCETRRGEVIRYVQQRYGTDRVAQIITFGRLKARAVLKDTGRVLQMPYGQIDRLAKLVPNHPTDPWTLERSLNGVSELAAEYKNDDQVTRLFDLAMKLEGLPRHASTHAAGVVIGDRRLDALVPLYRDPRSDMPVTQFDMKYVEAAGLVKFDFLGLKTLSVLRRAQEMLAAKSVAVDFDALPWDDPDTFTLLQRGDTVGVFQLESEGMRRTLAAVKPTTFEDIIALGALYRPGPMDNIPMFGARKNGREPIAYPHSLLAPVLAETYGIFVYQEQVMQAAQVVAGFSLGEADLLRRAMGKKVQAEMDAQRERFVSGAGEKGLSRREASALFDLIDKFAGYGFNKSHAAAYALITYQTAWLKAHHPAVFYAASMCFDIGLTDKLCQFVDDMRRSGVTCLPPCVNASSAAFTVEGDAVRFALGALKGVGEGAMEQLCAERTASGPFKSLDDFADRIDPRVLNRRQIESLAGAGAFDSIAPARPAVFAAAETILAHAAQAADARESGQGGLFGTDAFGGVGGGVAPIQLPRAAAWSLAERMAREKDAFGFYFSAHPVDRYRHLAEANGAKSFSALASLPTGAEGGRTGAVMAGLVEEARWRTSAKGKRYLIALLSDASGQFEATVFDDTVAADIDGAARVGGCGLFTVELDRRPGEEAPRVTVKRIQPFEALARRTRVQMAITVADTETMTAIAAELKQAHGGSGQVQVEVIDGPRTASLLLGRDFDLDAELAARIERIAGPGSVTLTVVAPPQLALVG